MWTTRNLSAPLGPGVDNQEGIVIIMNKDMHYNIEDLENSDKFNLILMIPYSDLASFVIDWLRKRSMIIISFIITCIGFLVLSEYIRHFLSGAYPGSQILLHGILGFILLPVLIIPVHEILHIIPYWLTGARNIRIGMDLRQFIFYVTAHKYVAGPGQFRLVAIFPFALISLIAICMIFIIPGIWKYSLAAFLFAHATMCVGDIALLNFYHLNRHRKIYTWDDADGKVAYFYEMKQ